jgi:hypothetical protein
MDISKFLLDVFGKMIDVVGSSCDISTYMKYPGVKKINCAQIALYLGSTTMLPMIFCF